MVTKTNQTGYESYLNISALRYRFHFASLSFSTFVLFYILVMLLMSCSGINTRIKKHKAEFDSYPKDIRELIKEGKIRKGFTQEQVYISLGDPDFKTDTKWTYLSCDWRTFTVRKDDFFYESEYRRKWEDYLEDKKKNEKAVFIPPSRYEEESRCRRYVERYLYFREGVLNDDEFPIRKIWIDSSWR